MRKIGTMLLISCLWSFSLSAQESIGINNVHEWEVENTNGYPGERVVAVIQTPSIGSYTGVSIVGTVIDNNGNWGYRLPTVASFRFYMALSNNFRHSLIQNERTDNIILGLRKISDTKYHLIANCRNAHTSMRVIFKKVEGFMEVTPGDPNVNTTEGSQIIESPTYQRFPNGKLGIGTTSPDHPLDVIGTVRAHEIIVSKARTADFVFEEDYELQSLDEIEKYIKEHKHLPQVHSANTMKRDGVKQSEMNQVLLQKIEELTLHLIQQNKNSVLQSDRIDSLIQRNSHLENELNKLKESIKSK
ncbi:hypothetical protein EYV94_27925 [Puteibacter caeruleilacunae]|nr:hypothetical protein EYV94_27925 [Puteibacter caeruleilacunae]